MTDSPRTTSTLTIAVSWLVVALPLGWGVYQSVVKSLPLFRMASGGHASSTRK